MIQGFSNASTMSTFSHLEFDAAMPMPFKIPRVLEILLNPKTDLNFTRKQNDIIEALRFSATAKQKLFHEMALEEQKLLEQMMHADEKLNELQEQYQEIQTHKMEASEIFFDLINTIAEELDKEQYKKLLELAGISV